jgi:tetratricopeptide (TPR) repeat protein
MRIRSVTIAALVTLLSASLGLAADSTAPISNPNFASSLAEGVSFLHRHRFNEALAKFEEALAIKPKSAHAMSLKARTLRNLNRTDEAMAAVKKAMASEPKSVQPYLALASFSMKDKNIAKAKEYLTQAERIEPHNAEVAGLMSSCLVLEKNYKGALIYANEAVKRQPDALRFAQRAAIYRMLGDRAKELKDYDKAVALEPKSPNFATERATTLFYVAKYQQAMNEVNRALSLDVKFAPAYYIRGNINWILKRGQSAFSDLNRALSMEENGSWYHFRGSMYEVNRDYRAALNDQLKADKLLPDQPHIKYSISRLYQDLLEPKQALRYINEAIKLDSKNSEYYDHRSAIYRTMMEYELATRDDNRSIEFSKKPPINALINRIRYNRFNKKFDLALKDQNRIISYFPNRVGLKEGRALIYLERADFTHNLADYQHAKEDLDAVITKFPNDHNYEFRAKANLKLGNLKAALADINQAIVKQPGMSSYYQLRADIHKSMGKPDEARKDLSAAKAADDAAMPPH